MRTHVTWIMTTLALCLSTLTASAQTYYDMASGIIQQGQSEESQIWATYNASLQAEQALYRSAMNDPRVQASYQQFLAAGGNASLEEYAVYYVRSAGGNAGVFNNYMNRVQQLNAQDRAAIFETHDYLNQTQQQIMNDRAQSMWNYSWQTGELLNGSATYSDGNYNYQIPTTLNYGQYSRDPFGNTFTVDQNQQYYRWTNWGWQPLTYTNGR